MITVLVDCLCDALDMGLAQSRICQHIVDQVIADAPIAADIGDDRAGRETRSWIDLEIRCARELASVAQGQASRIQLGNDGQGCVGHTATSELS